MGFRFRKSLTILPGFRLNFSKSGVSASLGVPGATINLGKRGARGTVGIPGTGLSYSEQLYNPGADVPQAAGGSRGCLAVFAAVGAVLAVFVMLSPTESGRNTATSTSELDASLDATALGASNSTEQRVTVNVDILNCRSNPTVRAESVGKLARSRSMVVVDTQAGWSLVQDATHNCWVKSDFLRKVLD